jgi:hypothetical protein
VRLALVLVVLLLTAGYVVSVERRLEAVRAASSTEAGDVKTTWTSGGVVREVRTTQQPGETASEHEERHFALVRAKRLEFPPDS